MHDRPPPLCSGSLLRAAEYVATYKREPLYADRVQGSAIAVVAIVVPLQAAIATGGGVLVPL